LDIYLNKGGNHGLQIKERRLWNCKESHSEEGTSKEEEIRLATEATKRDGNLPSLFYER
jgi:hypothetical protein